MLSRITIIGIASMLSFGQVPRPDVENALTRFEKFRAGDGTPALNEALATIRTKTAVGDAVTWKRLRAVIENRKIPPTARTAVLQISIEKADASIAKDMLSLFDAWSSALPLPDAVRQDRPQDSEMDARLTLMGFFVGNLRNQPLDRWIGSDLKTIGLLERILIRTGPSMGINHDALESLAASKSAAESRRAAAERIVAARPNTTEHEAKLLELLNTSSYGVLRTLVKQTNDPDKFHFGAAAALAHLGDSGIRGDLESLVPVFEKKDHNTGGMLRYYLWQIDAQNPPTNLLDFIVAAPQNDKEKRMWAIRRAVDLGVSKSKIRETVLQHASLVQPAGKHHMREGLASLKALCIQLGILDATDLPGVAVAQGTPTP